MNIPDLCINDNDDLSSIRKQIFQDACGDKRGSYNLNAIEAALAKSSDDDICRELCRLGYTSYEISTRVDDGFDEHGVARVDEHIFIKKVKISDEQSIVNLVSLFKVVKFIYKIADSFKRIENISYDGSNFNDLFEALRIADEAVSEILLLSNNGGFEFTDIAQNSDAIVSIILFIRDRDKEAVKGIVIKLKNDSTFLCSSLTEDRERLIKALEKWLAINSEKDSG